MLLDLSLVTQALTKLLHENVKASPAWNPANTLSVSPQPPDKLKGERTIGLYLYHVREEAHTKSGAAPSGDAAPVRLTPMGLALYYVLTTHSEIADENQQIYAEQLLMGLAVKTLRDFAKLDDGTMVGPAVIFPAALQGHENKVRLRLQPITYSDAMQYWTAGTQALRLAAYYEASAVLLEPEPTQTLPRRVLSAGVHTFLRGAPRLDGTRSELTFTLPGETTPRVLTASPAQVTYGQKVTLFGSELAGQTTRLVLTNRRFAGEVAVSSALWGVGGDDHEVTATIQATAGPETVYPGTYGATLVVSVRKTLPGGQVRTFDTRSNETPFAIIPKIVIPVPAPVAGLWTLTGSNFDPAVLTDDAVQVFAGVDRLARVTAGAPAAGEFRTFNATTLRFRLPAGTVAGTVLSVRVVVNGAESTPLWIVAT